MTAAIWALAGDTIPARTVGQPQHHQRACGRDLHTEVWTGSEMIVWGGFNIGHDDFKHRREIQSGTDSWTATSTTNAPICPSLSHGSVDRQRDDRLGRSYMQHC